MTSILIKRGNLEIGRNIGRMPYEDEDRSG